MEWHDVDQNLDEWFDLRVGHLTGSAVKTIMANYGKAFGDPAKKYAVKLAREMVTGKRSVNESFSNEHTERGHQQEPIARALYEDEKFCTVTNGGYFAGDRVGCSPDGLVGDNGMIEIKSVLDHVHYANIKRGGVDPAYKWQVYFNLMLSGRDWIDFVSYCADFPEQTKLYIHRTHRRDDDTLEAFTMLRSRTSEFMKLVDTIKPIIRGD